VSLVEEDGSLHLSAEAGQSTLLSAPYDHSVSLDHISQHTSLLHIHSSAFFRRRKSTEQSDNVIADPTRHIIQDLNLTELQSYYDTDGSSSTQVSYAAVPIKSVSGQLLGIYSVTDSKIRNDFMDDETYNILHDIASATSRYLDSQHTQLEKERDIRAKLNLSTFLEHNRPQPARKADATRHVSNNHSQPGCQNSSSANSSPCSNTSDDMSLDEFHFSAASTPLTTPAEECSGYSFIIPPLAPISDEESLMDSFISTNLGDQPPHQALSDAVNQIRAAHDIDGLALLDASWSSDHSPLQTTAEQMSMCKVLEVSTATGDHTPARIASSMSVKHESLNHLVSHFPGGCIFRTGDEGLSALVVTDRSRSGPVLYEKLDKTIAVPSDLQLLLDQTRSLIFMPLWDSARQVFYAGMLGWTANPIRVFTEHDLLSLSIYGRILTAEVTRLGTYPITSAQKVFTDSQNCRCH
jgi:hypothetical protein